MAVPTFRSAGVNNSSATSATMTVPQPAGLVAGDLLVLISASSGLSTQVNTFPTTGWTSLPVQPGGTTVTGSESGQVCYKIATAADVALANPSFTWSAAVAKIGILLAFTGTSQTTPVNKFASIPVNNTTLYDAPSVTPDQPESLIVCCVGSRASSPCTISSTDLTMRSQTTRANQTAGAGTENGPAAGSPSGTNRLTFSVTDGGFAYTLAVVPPSTDVTPPAAPTGLTCNVVTA